MISGFWTVKIKHATLKMDSVVMWKTKIVVATTADSWMPTSMSSANAPRIATVVPTIGVAGIVTAK